METAPMIWSIMSGSLIRATPPSALMSAGTRSSAMTATAPASSAIFACSGVTTSMITPPLSMSAIPRFTRWVPVTGAASLLVPGLSVEPWTDTGLPRFDSCAFIRSMLGPALRRSAGQMRHVRPLLPHAARCQGVVDLEELRQRRAARQPEHPRQPAPSRGHRDGDRVVVELPRDEDLLGSRFELGDKL